MPSPRRWRSCIVTTPREAIQARIDLDKGAHFRAVLTSRVNSLQRPIDAATAGLLMKWGPVVDQLASTFPEVSIDALLANVAKVAKKTEVDEFRRMLRQEIADRVLGVADPESRVKALLDMIEVQPDSASRGHLFGEFRQRLQKADPKGVLKPDGQKPPPFYEKGFKATRQPDDVIELAAGHPDFPDNWAGTWLGEDKAGEGAFKIEQLEDLAKVFDPRIAFKHPGSKTVYKGEIFFFSEEQWAKNAQGEILGSKASHLLDGDPPGVILMYLDPKTGQLERYVAETVTPQMAPKGVR